MGQDPEQLRAEIARTRAELDQDLEVLGEKVSPGKIAQRRVSATKDAIAGVKDKVLGSDGPSGPGGSSSAGATFSQAPEAAMDKASNNPLVAAGVAFGVGWLLSSLLPASNAETQATAALMDQIEGPVKKQVTRAAAEAKQELLPAAQKAAATIKDTAAEASASVKDEAAEAAGEVKGKVKTSGTRVAKSAEQAKKKVQGAAHSPAGTPAKRAVRASTPKSKPDKALAARRAR